MSFPVVPLRRLFRIVNGGTPNGDERNWGGSVEWATPVDLAKRNGRTIKNTDRRLTKVGLETGSRRVPPHSLIVSTRAPIGYVAENTSPMAFNQGCRGLVPKAAADTRYFRYQLSALTEQLQMAGQGSTFVELSTDGLAETEICSPLLETQRAIADYLDTETARIDALITKKRHLIKLLEERRWAARSHAIGCVPSARSVRLRHVISRIGVGVVVNPSSYFTNDSTGVPFVHGSDIADGVVRTKGRKRISRADSDILWRSQLEPGDVLVVRAGYPGRAAVVPDHLAGANCASVLILKRSEAVLPDYLAAFFNSSLSRQQIEACQYGAAQEQVNVGHVVDFTIPLPPLSEQKQILARIGEVDSRITKVEEKSIRQVDLLIEHRQALITAAVTGDLEIPAVAA